MLEPHDGGHLWVAVKQANANHARYSDVGTRSLRVPQPNGRWQRALRKAMSSDAAATTDRADPGDGSEADRRAAGAVRGRIRSAAGGGFALADRFSVRRPAVRRRDDRTRP